LGSPPYNEVSTLTDSYRSILDGVADLAGERGELGQLYRAMRALLEEAGA